MLVFKTIPAYAYKSRRRSSLERENAVRTTGKRRTLPLHGIAKGFATNLAALRYGARTERPEDDAACDTGGNRAFRAGDGRRTGRRVGDGRGGLAHTLKPLTREKLVAIAVDPQD